LSELDSWRTLYFGKVAAGQKGGLLSFLVFFHMAFGKYWMRLLIRKWWVTMICIY